MVMNTKLLKKILDLKIRLTGVKVDIKGDREYILW
jgi:hypothetical protein